MNDLIITEYQTEEFKNGQKGTLKMILQFGSFNWRLDVWCYMSLWNVTVLELDSQPDHNKGPDHAHCACP